MQNCIRISFYFGILRLEKPKSVYTVMDCLQAKISWLIFTARTPNFFFNFTMHVLIFVHERRIPWFSNDRFLIYLNCTLARCPTNDSVTCHFLPPCLEADPGWTQLHFETGSLPDMGINHLVPAVPELSKITVSFWLIFRHSLQTHGKVYPFQMTTVTTI